MWVDEDEDEDDDGTDFVRKFAHTTQHMNNTHHLSDASCRRRVCEEN